MMIAGTFLTFIFASIVSWVIWKLFKHSLRKSPLDVLPGPPSPSFFSGNIPQLYDADGSEYHQHIRDCYGRASRITGALGVRNLALVFLTRFSCEKERLLFTFDPKALHHILVKDQYVYEESSGFIARNEVYFGEGLLATLGDKHKKQRKMMNPVFSNKHMRDMVPLFYEVTNRLRATFKEKVKDGSQEVDIHRWMSRVALELIGQSGMGYSFDNLVDENPNHPYPNSLRKFALLTAGPFEYFTSLFIFPVAAKFKFPRVKRFIIERIPWKRVREIKEMVDVMHHTSLEIIQTKKAAMNSVDPTVAKEMLEKKDIISILMRENSLADEADRLADEEVCAQVSTFVLAGMETTSSAMSRILHLLSTHPDVQTRLRSEIREAQKDGQLSYDELVALPYLDAVCRETLRVRPPVNFAVIRTARKDMILPLSKPVVGLNGKAISEIIIPNGTNIILSLLGSNTNPDLWGDDAYEWKPERWLSPLPQAVTEARIPGVYSHLMTFLAGGRACMFVIPYTILTHSAYDSFFSGLKFSQLEMKVVLAFLLSSFKFEASKTHKITWKMTGVVVPYVEDLDRAQAQMPLVMTSLGPNSS